MKLLIYAVRINPWVTLSCHYDACVKLSSRARIVLRPSSDEALSVLCLLVVIDVWNTSRHPLSQTQMTTFMPRFCFGGAVWSRERGRERTLLLRCPTSDCNTHGVFGCINVMQACLPFPLDTAPLRKHGLSLPPIMHQSTRTTSVWF
jgi:hypothetical protein